MDEREELERDLFEIVGDELHEVAWHADFPVNPEVGLWCLMEGFRDRGIYLDRGQDVVSFFINHVVGEQAYELNTTLSFDQILRGWGRRPRGTTHALYDSICAVYDRMGNSAFSMDDFTPENIAKRNEWAKFRNTDTKLVRKAMEVHLGNFFRQYHEHVLLSVGGEAPDLHKPDLIHRVIKAFPMWLLEDAIASDELAKTDVLHEQQEGFNGFFYGGPTAETMIEEGWHPEEFSIGEYHPSESTMLQLFMGRYFQALADLKGYKTWYGDEDTLGYFVARGRAAFAYGRNHDWPEYMRNERGISLSNE